MENDKCCPNGDCEKCKCSKMGMCCGYKCCGKKCWVLTVLISVLVLVAIFYLGAMVGNKEEKENFSESGTGSVTVEVLPDTTVKQ